MPGYQHIVTANYKNIFLAVILKLMLMNYFFLSSICELLKKKNNPSVNKVSNMIGTEKPNPKNEIRGSKFLEPKDERFESASINPILDNSLPDKPIDYLSFQGKNFKLKIGDIVERFKEYRIQANTYDGGTQVFFYPIPVEYEFSAIEFWINKNEDDMQNILNISSNNIAFHFGDKLSLARDGYHMKR
jgi:hypothetical protein